MSREPIVELVLIHLSGSWDYSSPLSQVARRSIAAADEHARGYGARFVRRTP